MKRTFYFSFVSLLASSFAILTPILQPLAALGDRFLTFGLTFLDSFLPMPALATVNAHPMRPTREVTYLKRGLHRLAQPISMRQGDPDDDEDDEEDALDNGLTGTRLHC